MTRAEQIARARRQQPIAELERKARKAGRRCRRGLVHGAVGFSEEAKDLSFAKHHAWSMSFRAKVFVEGRAPDRFCSSCCGMGTKAKPVAHRPNCSLGLTPPQVYAGTMFTGAGPGPKGRLP